MLFQQRHGETEEEAVDVEGDGEHYEHYAWAGNPRIRASAMMDGRCRVLGGDAWCDG